MTYKTEYSDIPCVKKNVFGLKSWSPRWSTFSQTSSNWSLLAWKIQHKTHFKQLILYQLCPLSEIFHGKLKQSVHLLKYNKRVDGEGGGESSPTWQTTVLPHFYKVILETDCFITVWTIRQGSGSSLYAGAYWNYRANVKNWDLSYMQAKQRSSCPIISSSNQWKTTLLWQTVLPSPTIKNMTITGHNSNVFSEKYI